MILHEIPWHHSPLSSHLSLPFFPYSLILYAFFLVCAALFIFFTLCPITNDNDNRGRRLGHIQVISSLRYFFFFYSLFTLMAFFLLRLCPCMAVSNHQWQQWQGPETWTHQVISSLTYFFFLFAFFFNGLFFYLDSVHIWLPLTLTNVDNRGLRC